MMKPTIYNETLTVADTEYVRKLPHRTEKIEIQAQGPNVIRIAFDPGKVATPTAPYAIIKSGGSRSWEGLENTDLTLYMGSAVAGAVVEIVAFAR